MLIFFITILIFACICFFLINRPSEEKPYSPSDALVGGRTKTPLRNPKHLESKRLSTGTVLSIKSDTDEYNYTVVGTSYYQQALTRIARGKSAESVEITTKAILRLEPNNVHDNNAVAVFISSSQVGYLPRDDAFDFTTWTKNKGLYGKVSNFQCNAIILGGWKRHNDEGKFGVALNLPDDLDDLKTH